MFFSKRNLIAFLFLFCIVLSIFFLSSTSAPTTLRSSVFDVAKFPLLLINGLSHELKAVIFFHRSYWQNFKLSQENERLKAQALDQAEMLAENERLRNLLDLKSRAPFETTTAQVIGRDADSFRAYLILDKGRASGIKKYAAVLTHLGLVGKILEVGRYSSKVILINDPDLSVPALDVRTREQGLVSGTLDGKCKLRFLDLESDVRPGDLIVTSGLNMTYPEGLLIGKVRLVGVESSGLGKFAILEPALKVSSVEEVLIVTSY